MKPRTKLPDCPKFPRKLKKAIFSDPWNYGLTKYIRFNKRIPLPGSNAYIIAMWYCFKSNENKGYIADKETKKLKQFKLKRHHENNR